MRRTAWGTSFFLIATFALALAPVVPAVGSGASRSLDRNANKVFDDLDRALGKAGAGEELDVIAIFAGGDSTTRAAQARAAIGDFDVNYAYETMSAVAATMTTGQVRALAARSSTVQVQRDRLMETDGGTARAAFGADKAVSDFAVDGNNESGACPGLKDYCADDAVIAIVDTGIDNTHVDLDGGKVLAGIDCTLLPCSPGMGDNSGHGSHVASIAAGEGDGNTTYRGVAPGAALVNVEVSSGGLTPQSQIDAGLEWTIANKSTYGIDILNMSISASGPADGTDSTSRLINKAAAAGITPFVSAGNGVPDPGNVGSPSAAKYAVTVTNFADPLDTEGMQRPGFALHFSTRRGPTADGRVKPDFGAPGSDITAAATGTTNGYEIRTGTSMSAPFAAGVGALMIDANPALGSTGTACALEDTSVECNDGVIDATMATTLKDTMKANAVDWGPSGPDNESGVGRLDAYAAVDAASALAGTGGVDMPTHTFSEGSLSGTGAVAEHTIAVTGTEYPISIGVVMNRSAGATSPNFDLELRDPAGTLVDSSATGSNVRQEWVAYRPTVTGNYTLRVISTEGAGSYFFDASFAGKIPDSPPPAPSTIGASSTSSTQIDVSWSDVSGETEYKLERASSPSGAWAKIASTASDVTSYSNTGLAPSTTYYYRVIASNAAGDSPPSGVAGVSTQAQADTTAPTTPTRLKASSGRAKVTLTWVASTDSGGSGLAGYKVYRSTTGSTGTYTQIAAPTTTSYVDTAVSKGKTYWYYVKAYDNANNHSAASSKVSGKPT